MCGIVGIVSKDAKNFIHLANAKIAHRGPDDEGFFIENNVALGHRRLSIQDLSLNGHQPMMSGDERYCIIFNGEIYNHWEIRKEIKHKYDFTSTSDTQTILYGYIEYGKEILNKLNGIFAFAIFDRHTKEIFIARDQFGVKPLYYYFDKDLFWFGSEIKSLLPIPFKNDLSEESLADYLTFLWSPGEKTPFEHVKKLLPGHYIHLNINDLNSFSIEKYYEIPFDNSRLKLSEKELIEELEKKLIKAVDRQLLSDVPVGFFLSGGLDSSCVVALARKLHPDRKFDCYTINSNGNNNEKEHQDDLYYAHIVAKHLNVNLIEVPIDVNIVKEFDEMIYHLDEPQADPAPLNVLHICKQARKDGNIVLLSGTAGDDLFSGYRRHVALNMEKTLRFIPLPLRKTIRFFTQKLPTRNNTLRRIRKITSDIHLSKIDRIMGYFSWIDKNIIDNLFSTHIRTSIKNYVPLSILKKTLNNIPQEQNDLNKFLFLELKYFLTDHNLNYTDKMSMATGIEVRVPFLDKELLEFSTKIPTELKLKGIETKYILKKVMEKYLPKEVIYRSKSGFGAPVRKWITQDLDDVIQSRLSKDIIEKRGIFDYDNVQKLIIENKANRIDASYTIWSLLAIESWMHQFYDNSENKKS